ADHTLDNLIANGDISELIGVFVRPNDRNSEYAGAERVQYRQFFVEELVPYIDANYRTVDDPARRAVLGASFGGNISALISFNHPDLFGLCGLHSGAFWPNSYETNGVVLDGPAKEIRVASVWGSYEGSLSGNMTMVGDELLLQGYDLYSNEYPEGHSWGLWRATLDELLIFFFPPGLTPAPEVVPTASSLVLFPNPARERVTLDRTSFQGEVVLLNAFGQEVLRTELQGPELELPPRLAPGLYWLLIAEEGRQRAVGRL
ncbi:MAG: esterase family protein, partial [Saprospiraceae bacterium]|nr:esterase family protein [Saprospiraceae bacterium]